MIYDEPRFLPGGDRYVLIEFGNDMTLKLNFMAHGLARAIAESGTKGVIETAPCFASMLLHYDPDVISLSDLKRQMLALVRELGPSDDIELPSRLFYLPATYLDPWTKACVEDYCAKIAQKQWDPELIVVENMLEDLAQFVRVHSGTEYWVASLGFWPGLPFMMPLDPRCVLTAPKYNPPRTNTPQGAIGLGGAAHSIYPVATPGGYQIFARTPVPIWDPDQRFDAFADSICLFRPGDRIRFVPCSVEEFHDIDARVKAGSYVYDIVDYQNFSVRRYRDWVSTVDRAKRF